MIDFYFFANEHPFLAWCLLWWIWPICWAVRAVFIAPFAYAYRAYNQRLRAKNIAKYGWPTAQFLNADGDIIYPAVKEKKSG